MGGPFINWVKRFLWFTPVVKDEPIVIPHDMRTAQNGIELIKSFEGFRSNPYLDVVGVPTIGYGFTYYPNGHLVRMNDKPITEKEAETILKEIVKVYEKGVNLTIKASLTQNQFDALVSFSFNLGNGALSSSTLAKRINVNPNDPDIRNQFMRWVKAGNRELPGLVRRRKAEADLYFTK